MSCWRLRAKMRGAILAACCAAATLPSFAQSGASGADSDGWLDALLGLEDEDLFLEPELLLAEGLVGMEASAYPLTPPSAWSVDSELGFGMGWKDNVLHSSGPGVDSVFGQAMFDVFAMRPGAGDRSELVALLFGDYRHYDSVPGLSSEHLVVAHAQGAARFWGDTKGTAAVEGVHSRQAFDASMDDFETDAMAVTLWQPEVKGALEKELPAVGMVKALAGASRAYYSEKSENYDVWDYGLGWTRPLTDRFRFSTTWKRFHETYDERRARVSNGSLEDPPYLKIRGDRWDMEWVYLPSEGALRKSRSRVLFQVENDPVGDYYERDQWEIRQSLEWTWGEWSLETAGSFGNLDYATRPAQWGLPGTRGDETLRLNAELSRQVSQNLRAFARYERVDKDSNADPFSYAGNAAAFGIRLSRSSPQ